MTITTKRYAGILLALLPAMVLAEDRTYPLPVFRAAEFNGAEHVVINMGPHQSVTVHEPDGRFKEIQVVVRGRRLLVDRGPQMRPFWQKAPDYTVIVVVPTLDAMTLSGAVDGRVRLSTRDLLVNLAGASRLELHGSCNRLTVNASGAARLVANNFNCDTVSITTSGAANASVYAHGHLLAQASGASHIDVRGKPVDVHQSNSGASSISFLARANARERR